jgi:ketosteroid isomerase-like protein
MRLRVAVMAAAVLFPSLTLSGSAATPAGEPPAKGRASGDAGVLMAVDAQFAALVAEKGFAAFGDFFAEDAVYLPMYAPLLEGHEAIMSSFRPLFDDPTVRLTWKPLRADIAKSGDLGWTTGSYEVTAKDKEGATVVRHGKYVTIWRKQANGAWKAVLDGGNPDEPPAPKP